MQLFLMTMILCALGAAAGKRVAVSDRPSHHSTKKQLRPDPASRLPRGSEAQGSDADPALAYALPPASLLSHGQGFGYGLGQGPEAAALAALVSSGLHEGRAHAYAHRPVYHFSPLEQHALLAQDKPIEEPRQEQEEHVAVAEGHGVQDVQVQAHSFVDPPNLYTHGKHEDEYKDYAAKYQFGYRVRDLHTGNDFGQTESRDGHMTQGQYHVLLPDGRLQNVQYWSDHSGFHAKVSYDGHAHHIH